MFFKTIHKSIENWVGSTEREMGWKYHFVTICGKIFSKLIWNRGKWMGQWKLRWKRTQLMKISHNQHDQINTVKPFWKGLNIYKFPKSKIFYKTTVTIKSSWTVENLRERGAGNHVLYKFKIFSLNLLSIRWK